MKQLSLSTIYWFIVGPFCFFLWFANQSQLHSHQTEAIVKLSAAYNAVNIYQG